MAGEPVQIDLRDADAVCDALLAGAGANRTARCRSGSVDRIHSPGRLVATGDLHDNPFHFDAVVAAARLNDPEGAHLTLHEMIHSDRLLGGVDMSYRALARAASLKAAFPERIHTLLANHELSQMVGAGIVKDGVRVVEAFNAGIEYAFGGDAERVEAACVDFIRSMPLALRAGGINREGQPWEILCAHSIPSPAMMQRFDPGILSREIREEDYEPRQGSAHLMVWGRGYDAELLEDLVERWGVNLFILGHEHAERGVRVVLPNAVVLNSDHEHGVYWPIDLSAMPRATDAPGEAQALWTG